ncbi:putative RNA-directed DNA polymerase from transposon X-element [Araneus ventricosus]|uniref:Putative RNA-directed DNA polymerase from transposon X-element n=1 Tax=Araneus ventricosus TaxID=182803 RepID=A0A4Y2AKM4_ARAVE|nr:putative RNA-directed DNA polymerase from transposon X-element [Araneus ventricosus]
MIALKIQTSSFPITIISAYSSPAQNVHTTLQEIQEIISSLPEKKIIIGADLNGHNTLWGYRSNDNRGKDILDFILANNLNIINKPNALPTFQRNNSVGWPDLTLCSQSLIDSSINWERSLPSVWEAVQVAFRKSVFPSQIPYLINGDPKGSLQEAAQNILDQSFLSPAILTNYNLTTSTQPPDPPFFPQEISVVIEHLPSGKAPGIYGIDNLLIKIIHKRFNNIFPTFFNKCLHLSCFPDFLKIGNIILFQKGGKDQRLASSYRPISLLPSIGKVLEKLMTQRLTYHLESTNSLNYRQHDFREGKSVDTAINELLRKIKTARRDGKHVLVLSIDIKRAFDNLQHRAILKSLDASACPSNINRLFHDLLQNRKLTLLTKKDGSKTEGGVGAAFCVLTNDIWAFQWSAKRNDNNNVFQADLTALHKAVIYASHLPSHNTTKIHVDNRASIMASSNSKSTNETARIIFKILLSNPRTKVSWVKMHASIIGNERADQLEKDAT